MFVEQNLRIFPYLQRADDVIPVFFRIRKAPFGEIRNILVEFKTHIRSAVVGVLKEENLVGGRFSDVDGLRASCSKEAQQGKDKNQR